MAQIDFEALKQRMKENEERSANAGTKVPFFFLKDDKDEALVRIMHDTPESFDIVACHPMKINGKFRKVNCLRAPKDPVENCPFCDAGIQLQYRFYIHLVEYTKDEKGQIIATPKVWERATNYVDTFNNLINNYGPLSNQLFKIVRNGKAGSMETTYDIFYVPPMQIDPNSLDRCDEVFKTYKALGSAVIDTDYNGAIKMLNPETESTSAASTSPVANSMPTMATGVVREQAAPRTYAPVNAAPAAPVNQPRTYEPSQAVSQPAVSHTAPVVPQAPVTPTIAAAPNPTQSFATPASDGFARPRRFYNN